MFFKQCLNRNIIRIVNSQLNSIRNMNTNTNISNEVLDKELEKRKNNLFLKMYELLYRIIIYL